MADIRFVFDRTSEVAAAISSAVRKAEKELADGGAEAMKTAIKTGPRSGRIYNRKPKGRHQASAPGEAPANLTGGLADSIESAETEAGSTIRVTGEMAHTLEMGSAGGKVAPRPFVQPVADAIQEAMPDAIAEAVRGAIN